MAKTYKIAKKASKPISEGAKENIKVIDTLKKTSKVIDKNGIKVGGKTLTSSMFNIGLVGGDLSEPERILLIGNSKSGRTFLSASFPKPLIINIDGGLKGLRGKDIPEISLKAGGKTHSEVYDILMAIENKKDIFAEYSPETVVLDDFSGMSEFFETEVKYYDRSPEHVGKDGLFLNEYNIIQCRLTDILNIIKSMRSVKYIVVICSPTLVYDPNSDGTFMYPAATGQKFSPRIPTSFGEVYACSYNAKEKTYELRTEPSKIMPFLGTRYAGKMPDIIKNPSFKKLEAIYNSGINLK